MDADDGVAARGAEPTAFAAVGAATASAHRRVPLIPPLPAATATARDAPSAASARATPRAASRALGGAARRALHVEICRCLAWLHGKVRGAQEREDAARAAVGVYTRTTSAPAVKVRALRGALGQVRRAAIDFALKFRSESPTASARLGHNISSKPHAPSYHASNTTKWFSWKRPSR